MKYNRNKIHNYIKTHFFYTEIIRKYLVSLTGFNKIWWYFGKQLQRRFCVTNRAYVQCPFVVYISCMYIAHHRRTLPQCSNSADYVESPCRSIETMLPVRPYV